MSREVLRLLLVCAVYNVLSVVNGEHHYINEWAAEIHGGQEEAQRLAKRYGYEVVKAVSQVVLAVVAVDVVVNIPSCSCCRYLVLLSKSLLSSVVLFLWFSLLLLTMSPVSLSLSFSLLILSMLSSISSSLLLSLSPLMFSWRCRCYHPSLLCFVVVTVVDVVAGVFVVVVVRSVFLVVSFLGDAASPLSLSLLLSLISRHFERESLRVKRVFKNNIHST
ncbi:hypothetical protein BaRGS_00011922 [Batillaria attramentaria]|uniref:Uncharacterized protein n=1 Tax=Batillaria attramentaria TaxID=370345 RepID=A0ABD0LC11_9CAEN